MREMSKDHFHFWSTPSLWPLDPSGYVFLARAFHEIGRARFGQEWSGHEPYPDPAVGRPIVEILKSPEGHVPTKPDSELAHEEKGPIGSVAHEIEQARERQERLEAAKQSYARAQAAAFSRASIIHKEIIQQCEAGDLVSTWRPVRGGRMSLIERHCWNGANPEWRFYLCQMSLREPFSSGFAGDGFGYIFVERASLDRLLAPSPLEQPSVALPGLGDLHLSPYLKLMISVTRKLNITPENQPNKLHLAAVLREEWKGEPRLGATFSEFMAQAMREPESQLGKAGKKKD